MLEVKGISASYGSVAVLRDVSLRFPAGRLTAMIGPNGCGKSTLLRVIMGFVTPVAGQVTLDSAPLPKDRKALARRIAFLPQESHCPDYLTLGDLVELAGHSRYSLLKGPTDDDRARFRAALATVGLDDLAHTYVNRLSGGQRQRAWIAMVLAQDAEIIVMDEPVNHLDIKFQYAILSLIRGLTRQHGKTVIAVLHDLNLAAGFADHVAMLRDGQVIAVGPTEAVLDPSNVVRVFDIQTDMIAHAGRRLYVPHLDPA